MLFGKVALEITTHKCASWLLTVEDGREVGWSFLLSKTGRHFRARALERVRTFVFDGAALQKACEEDPVCGGSL